MTKENKKCPNCGHEFKQGEEYCPNCDLFIPINEQSELENTLDLNATKQFKTFKEKDIEKNVDDTHKEPTFKHRGETAESTKEKEQEEIPSVTQETNKNTGDTFVAEKEEPSVECDQIEETIYEDDLANTTIVSGQNIAKDLEEEFKEITSEETLPSKESQVLSDESIAKEESDSTPDKKKKGKAIIGMSAAVLLIAGGLTFYSAQQKKADEKATTELVSSAELNLNSLYSNSDHVFLKKDISAADIEKANSSLDKLKGKDNYNELKQDFDKVEEKFNKQKAMNELFKSPIIEGDKLNSKVFVKNADHIAINKIATEKDGFDILYNKGFAEAEEQKELLSKANDALESIYKDDKVIKNATREQYESAEKAIKGIKDADAKKDLQEKLEKVDKYLVENDKKQAELAAAEEQARLAQQQEQQQNNSIQPAQNNNNSNSNYKDTDSKYKWGNRKDENIDYNDAAWGWGPGVQEKVISEVISRGYVTEGGYNLVPKYVENGEGFYDLYATTNSKIFPNSKPEEFPLYVVTINAKTGWFKGNGPN
ncbi:MAG: cell division site-positioning protein MapZ family protein [Vagococcus sp.]|uniref:cell division site-positioning protein MapZ family protein n=1 Tax=Vagococcus sp. TaxID=1933889 RepID=UPI002FC6C90C